jgi:23S rRNA (uracil1939-C5)-methyltransferase
MKKTRPIHAPEVEVTVESLVPGGDGLARHEGKVIFIPGVLPQERVRVALVQRKKDYDRGECVTRLESSPDRVTPPCPVADRCGGCDWQHIRIEAQHQLKRDLALSAYARFGGFHPLDLKLEAGHPFGYRHRVQVHADAMGRLGFKGRRSDEIMVVQGCPVAHAALQPLFQSASPWRFPARFQAFGHATRGLSELVREDEAISHEMQVRVLGKDIRFSLKGFFQSNLEMLERLLPFALEGLQGRVAWDLYSGSGLFAAFLRDRFQHVLAIEADAESAFWIGQNTGHEVPVYSGKLEDLLAETALADRIPESHQHPDAIVVDPPREGLHASVREWLLQVQAKHLVYVSCDVVSQARDLKILLAGGYALKDLRLFDFYPQTHHLEAVARLEWKP